MAALIGLTGMRQVGGRSNTIDYEKIVKPDADYIDNWMLGPDIKILLKTFIRVIKCDVTM